MQEYIVPAPRSFIALRTIPYLHVQLLQLHLQLHQLSNYISCVSNELKGKNHKVHIALCCNKNVICIHRKKKISVSWKMKLDYLGVFCFSCMKPKHFCDIKKRLELFDNLRLHSNFFSWATVITVQFSVVIREIILHLELIGHSLEGRSLKAFFS